MDKYEQLLYHKNLYNEEIIQKFGPTIKKWGTMSTRNQELAIRHITCTILLCNLETLNNEKIIDRMKVSLDHMRKRKFQSIDEVDEPSTSKGIKARRTEENWSLPTKTDISEKSSKSSSEDVLEVQTVEIENEVDEYRLSIIRYMPNPEMLMNKYSELWKTETSTIIWDIADAAEEKFLNIYISRDLNKIRAKYDQEKNSYNNESSAILFEPDSLYHETINMVKEPNGIAKVKDLLAKRNQIMNELGIIETAIQEEEELIPVIMCSKWLNEACTIWKSDFMSSMSEKWDIEELYGIRDPPKTIRPTHLLKHLVDIEKRKCDYNILWRGKILPDGFIKNIKTTESKDSEMVTLFMSFLESELSEIDEINYNTSEKNLISLSDMGNMIKMWETSNKDPFCYFKPGFDPISEKIEECLGIGRKGKTFSAWESDMRQPEQKVPETRQYNRWIEEVMRRLSHNTDDELYSYYINLEEEPKLDRHPIAMVSERTVTKIVRRMMMTNAASYSSRLANFYSRLGGAYKTSKEIGNKERKSVSIFPIYSTSHLNEKLFEEKKKREKTEKMTFSPRPLNDSENESEDDESDNFKHDVIRNLSGIVIRGPQHAKSPTDRIAFITIEVLERTEANLYFCKHLQNYTIFTTKNFLIVVRRNSILKEDTCYVMFNINSIFVPINSFGEMTMNNRNLSQDSDMIQLQENIINSDKINWFIDRFVEGVVFSAIGNSRDEGYFAALRKTFMVVLAWRRGEKCANWDVESFCRKMNECLLDNPISMYFHKYLLRALSIYKYRDPLDNDLAP